MRVTTKVLFVGLSLSIALMGCKNPCEDALDEIRDEIVAFLADSDPFTEGAQPCQDEICSMAAAALRNDWPYFNCTSCDAAEIKLCNCYDDNAWMASFDEGYSVATPHYPASLYCLAKYYQQRSLCACAPCEAPNEIRTTTSNRSYCARPDGTLWYLDGDCYEYNAAFRVVSDENGEPIRVCDPNSDEGVMKSPILQQTDMCDAIVDAFDCASYDADFDGVPDQYDGFDPNDQDRSAKKIPENVECTNRQGGNFKPSAAQWQAWFENPCSLYDPTCYFFIDYDGNGRYEDSDDDGVANSCDNCPNAANGFDCLKIPHSFERVAICDADGDGVLTTDDLEQLGTTALSNCMDALNANAPFLKNCDVDGNKVVTFAELLMGDQKDSDGDKMGDACDNL